MKKIKAVSLFSGGLDSILATKIVMEEGIEVIGVTFRSPFYSPDKAIEYAEKLGIELKIIEFGEEYLDLILHPRHGYGKNMNPCIDCHAYMFKKAGEFMEKIGASFLVTGEVKGERPMSQNKVALKIVEEESGFSGKILRPLSAKLLPETEPEKLGYINREHLYAISGRSRKPQFELAKKYGIEKYPTPSGGCKLTDPGYAYRLKELILHNEYNMENILLLDIGRHFRLPSGKKLIVGRNKRENEKLLSYKGRYTLLYPKSVMGPSALLQSEDRKDIILSGEITLAYSDYKKDVEIIVAVIKENEEEIKIRPRDKEEFKKYLIRLER